jgi:hypothetical protein
LLQLLQNSRTDDQQAYGRRCQSPATEWTDEFMPPAGMVRWGCNHGRLDNSLDFELRLEANPHAGRWFKFGGQFARDRNNGHEIGDKLPATDASGHMRPRFFRQRRRTFLLDYKF